MSEYWKSQSPERVSEALMDCFRELLFIEETLAESLGYPRSDGGPDDPNGGGFITGEHTAASLALEAKRRLTGDS